VEGDVPVLAEDLHADQIVNVYMRVIIDSPQHGQSIDRDSRCFVLLADDLEAFTRMWYYSDLSYAGDLNRHLRLTLHLQNPLAEGPTDHRPLSKALQRKLLHPFGDVKNLLQLEVNGDGIDREGIEKDMRISMAVPYATPEHCVEECARLKDAGNVALKSNAKRAIELYIEAFREIHILCHGHRRLIWGDPWFERILQGGQFDGQHGQVVRLIMRVKLVASVVQAYLDLEDYNEAHFWGMRTILLMREAVGGEDEPLFSFPARSEMGMIYYRTGFACKMLGDAEEARTFLRVAALYLPNDDKVLEMLSTVAPRLG
jgi:hypothetical protein